MRIDSVDISRFPTTSYVSRTTEARNIAVAPPDAGRVAGGRNQDYVDFSAEGLARAQASQGESGPMTDKLSAEEQQAVEQLKQRDREVRQHEAAHLSAAGPYANGRANLEYTRGPDGRMYATGGDVSIDVGRERTPQATIQKMQVVKRAAMAPAQPSGQDRRVFAEASRIEGEARRELAQQRVEESRGSGNTSEVASLGSAGKGGG